MVVRFEYLCYRSYQRLIIKRMKTYSVYFTEPVTRHYKGDKFNQKTKQWEHDVDCEETKDTFTFYSPLRPRSLLRQTWTNTRVQVSQKHGPTVIGKTLVKSSLPGTTRPSWQIPARRKPDIDYQNIKDEDYEIKQ